MVEFSALVSCADLTVEQADQAASSPNEMRKLLARAVEISRPHDGCPKVLMAVARLVAQDWVEADIRVELSGDEEGTTLSILYDHGFGIRERLLPQTRLAVPLDEFSRALRVAPKLAAPLRLEEDEEEGKLVLVQSNKRSSEPAAPIRIHDASLSEGSIPAAAAGSSSDVTFVSEAEPLSSSPPPAAATTRSVSVVEKLSELDDVVPAPLAVNADALNVHTRPTKRMNTIDPEMIRAATGRRDPRRDEE